jgi:hypothetical protein
MILAPASAPVLVTDRVISPHAQPSMGQDPFTSMTVIVIEAGPLRTKDGN